MSFKAEMLTQSGLATAIEDIVRFATALGNLPTPKRVGQGASAADIKQFTAEASEFFERFSAITPPSGAGAGLGQAAREIEEELSRTRPAHLTMRGGRVVFTGGGISLIVDKQEQTESGESLIPDDGFLPCYAEKDGGTHAGDASNDCDFTYTVYDMDQATKLTKADGTAAEFIKPKKHRLVKVKYTTPSGKNLAKYCRDEDGELVLWDANEVPYPPEACV